MPIRKKLVLKHNKGKDFDESTTTTTFAPLRRSSSPASPKSTIKIDIPKHILDNTANTEILIKLNKKEDDRICCDFYLNDGLNNDDADDVDDSDKDKDDVRVEDDFL